MSKNFNFTSLTNFQQRSGGDCEEKNKCCTHHSGYSFADCLCYHYCNLGWNYGKVLSTTFREIRHLMKKKFGLSHWCQYKNHKLILCSVWWCRMTWKSCNDPIKGKAWSKSLTDHTKVLLNTLPKQAILWYNSKSFQKRLIT